jgi:rubrerythrin
MIELEALKLALSKEKGAVEAYKELLAKHPALKDLFYFLLNEEQKHVAMIEKKSLSYIDKIARTKSHAAAALY